MVRPVRKKTFKASTGKSKPLSGLLKKVLTPF